MKKKAALVTVFTVYLFFYPLHKWQEGSVPGLIITSEECEAQKTRYSLQNLNKSFLNFCFTFFSICKIEMKISSNLGSNMSNQGCSNEGIDELRSKTSLPVYRDDLESKRKRDVALVKSYDNTATHTIARGRKTLKAGILATENLGKRTCQIFPWDV